MKSTGRFKQRMHGSVAIMVGLAIAVLIAFLGIVIDLGHLYVMKTELSNASDSCALAAAQELDGQSDALVRADRAAQTVSSRNLQNFQSTQVAFTLNNTVTFSDQLQGTYLTQGSVAASTIPNMHYAQCTFTQANINPWFMQVVGFGGQTVASHAIAALTGSQSACAIPIGLIQVSPAPASCQTDSVITSSTPDKYGLCKGQWYGTRFVAGGGFTGSFDWASFTQPSGGATALKNWMTGTGACNIPTGAQVGKTGMDQSVADAWNTRFGLYHGSYSASNAPPDRAGFAYTSTSWPSQFDAYAGSPGSGTSTNYNTTAPNHTPYQGDAASGLNTPGGSRIDSNLATDGTTNRRIALMPIIGTPAWSSNPTTVLDWGCIFLLQPMQQVGYSVFIEYEGLATIPGSPCSSLGLPGGSGPLVPTLVR